jgi:hypothetical protein
MVMLEARLGENPSLRVRLVGNSVQERSLNGTPIMADTATVFEYIDIGAEIPICAR